MQGIDGEKNVPDIQQNCQPMYQPMFRRASLAAALLAIATLNAGAATATASFAVSVSVPATCIISASALTFAIYLGSTDDATSTLSLTCTNSTSYSVALGTGTASGASVTTRAMSSGGAHLPYALYRDAARTLNWGQTVGSDTVSGTGTGSAQLITVYGRVSAGQFVMPGSYSDTIIATVTY